MNIIQYTKENIIPDLHLAKNPSLPQLFSSLALAFSASGNRALSLKPHEWVELYKLNLNEFFVALKIFKRPPKEVIYNDISFSLIDFKQINNVDNWFIFLSHDKISQYIDEQTKVITKINYRKQISNMAEEGTKTDSASLRLLANMMSSDQEKHQFSYTHMHLPRWNIENSEQIKKHTLNKILSRLIIDD